jgi:hypothetical protein
MIPDHDVLPQIGIVSDLAVAANNCGALDHRPIFDERSLTDKNLLADESNPFTMVPQCGPQVLLDITLYLGKRFPRIMATLEQSGVFRLAQVE